VSFAASWQNTEKLLQISKKVEYILAKLLVQVIHLGPCWSRKKYDVDQVRIVCVFLSQVDMR
jgi:hypothetical protein